jgi:hypothetical protein
MRPSIRISLAWLISASAIAVSGCQNRAPSLRVLDTRAGYGAGLDDEEVALYQRGKQTESSLARRSAPRVARVYVYPHELPSRDFFWGGYVSLIVSQDEWIFENPEDSRKSGRGNLLRQNPRSGNPSRVKPRPCGKPMGSFKTSSGRRCLNEDQIRFSRNSRPGAGSPGPFGKGPL